MYVGASDMLLRPQQFPDPHLLASARADFGDMIATPEDSSWQRWEPLGLKRPRPTHRWMSAAEKHKTGPHPSCPVSRTVYGNDS